ncbi:MAG: type II secretion system protein [Candidatus Paceibacterota bacterium]
MLKRNKGFTLIELLVVIAIIGILSSVVLASLNSARKKSRDARRISDLKQIQLALEMYADASGSLYPAGDYATAMGLLKTGGFFPQIPVDPLNAGNNVYKYTGTLVSSSCTSYHLGATLEEATNPALNSDADDAGTASVCTGGTNFDGTGTGTTNGDSATIPVYDVKP